MEKISDLKKIILLDAPSLIYRAFYALPEMSTDNIPTNAVYGFSLMLLKLLKEEMPSYIAATFDTPSPTFRHKEYTDYKIKRPPTPDKLIKQIPIVKDVLCAFNIKFYEMDGYEADDLIATVVDKLKKGYLHIIVSGDLDMLQLVRENVYLVKPIKGVTHTIKYTPDEVYKKYSIYPEQIVDFKSLVGDKSDNISGAKGIGEKTAKVLLKKWNTVEEIMKNIDCVENKLRDTILSYKEQIMKNKDLLTLRSDLPLDVDINTLRVNPDIEKIRKTFQSLKFKTLEKNIEDIRSLSGQISSCIQTSLW